MAVFNCEKHNQIIKNPRKIGGIFCLVGHFRLGKNDMLAQFWVVFTEFHFTLGIFRFCVFRSCIKETSFFVFQLDNFNTAFFRCHFNNLYFYCVWYSIVFFRQIKCFLYCNINNIKKISVRTGFVQTDKISWRDVRGSNPRPSA